MKALERTELFGRRIRGWLPREPVAARREKGANRSPVVSSLSVVAVVFVAIGIGAELAFLPKASSQAGTQTTTTSTTPYCQGEGPSCVTPTNNLSSAVSGWVADFNTRNVAGLANFYTNDALVDWASSPGVVASGLNGVYSGIGNVRILYGSSIGKTMWLTANLSNYKETSINQDNANVSLTLTMNGNSSVVGLLSISVDASQQWNYVNGQWQIARENWNYVTFSEQRPLSSTTFPQWTAMKLGQNPDLVSEKSFEWHAGPYVAASVYAFLAGVLVLGTLRVRRRSGRA